MKYNGYSRFLVPLKPVAAKIAVLLAMMTSLQAQQVVSDFYNTVMQSGADPSIVRHTDGWYYRTKSMGNHVAIWRTRTLSGLDAAQSRTIWTPPAGTAYSQNVWAPELFFYNNRWYVYVAADNGTNANHRMYVLESAGADPFTGTWTFRGQLTDPSNLWAIDGTVFEVNGQLYTVWSGWPTLTNSQQNLYIATMSNPWTISSNRVQISTPTLSWETSTAAIQEGPEVIIRNGRINLVYSASASWTNAYCLGLLTANVGSNLLSASSWTKRSTPIFSSANGINGPGHHTFTKSLDGTEDWIVYHCARWSGSGWTRQLRMQKFTWNADNTPNLGTPVGHDSRIAPPSGEIERWRYEAESATLIGSPAVSSHATASNGQYVTLDAAGEAVQFAVNVPVAGEYVLGARSATSTADESSASFSVSVNGGSSSSLGVVHSGWQNWGVAAARITLPAGASTIRLTRNVANAQLDEIDLYPSDPATAISGRTFKLIVRHTGKCADVYQAQTANGTPIIQHGLNTGNSQRWVINSVGGGQYTFTSVPTGRMLEVPGSSTASGTQLTIWDSTGGNNQRWTITPVTQGYYKITAVHSGMVMDVSGARTADYAEVIQAPWNTAVANNQLWRLQVP